MAEGGMDSIRGRHDEYVETNCSRCEKRGNKTEADFYCQTCNQYFCSPCEIIHREFATDHCVLNESERHSWGTHPIDQDTEECVIHKGQRIIIYCRQHEALCCSVCASKDHSTCTKKDFIPDIVGNISESVEMKDVVMDICTLQDGLKKAKFAKSQMQLSLRDSRTRVVKANTEFLNKLDGLLRNMEKAVNQNMELLFQSRESELQTHLDTCDSLVSEFQSLQNQLFDSDTDAKRFLVMKNAKGKLLEARDTLNALSQPVDYDVHFTLDETLLENVEKAEVLGKFDIFPKPGKSTEIKRVEKFRECKIRAIDDKKACGIVAMCMLPDGTVLLADYTNSNIKRLDENYNVVESFKMSNSPLGICSIGTKEVAVALGGKSKVQIISVTDKMRKTEELTFKHACNAIAYSKDTLYIIGGWIQVLYVYAMKRNPTETACTLIRAFDDHAPHSVAASGDGSFVYVVGIHDKLIIQYRQGDHVHNQSTEHPNMKRYEEPTVCVDMRGNVLVCYKFRGILQFKDSGTAPNGILINHDKATTPNVVFVDYIRSKLILQRNTNNLFGGGDTVGVWDIVY